MAIFRSYFSLTNVIGNYRNFLLPRICLPNYERYLSKKGKTLHEEIGLPPRPKRPLLPFIRYLQMKRPVMKLEHPELKMRQITKLLSEGWATFDPVQKNIFQKQYDQEMLEYSKVITEYEMLITPEQKKQLQLANAEKRLSKAKLKDRQKRELLGKPKRPMNAYLQYCLDKLSMYDKTKMTYTDFVKKISAEYNELPESKKAELKMNSDKLLQEYKVALSDWEQKMIREGHLDVVRSSIALKASKNKNKE